MVTHPGQNLLLLSLQPLWKGPILISLGWLWSERAWWVTAMGLAGIAGYIYHTGLVDEIKQNHGTVRFHSTKITFECIHMMDFRGKTGGWMTGWEAGQWSISEMLVAWTKAEVKGRKWRGQIRENIGDRPLKMDGHEDSREREEFLVWSPGWQGDPETRIQEWESHLGSEGSRVRRWEGKRK